MALHKMDSYIEIGLSTRSKLRYRPKDREVYVLQYRNEKRFIFFIYYFFGRHWRLAYIYVGTTITFCIRTE